MIFLHIVSRDSKTLKSPFVILRINTQFYLSHLLLFVEKITSPNYMNHFQKKKKEQFGMETIVYFQIT